MLCVKEHAYTCTACPYGTPLIPRRFFYQPGHEVRTYIAIITRDAQLYAKVPLSDKDQLNTNLNITWALIISGMCFITQ